LQIDELDKNIKVFNKGQRYGFLKNKAELLFPRLKVCLKLWFLTFRGAKGRTGEGRWGEPASGEGENRRVAIAKIST